MEGGDGIVVDGSRGVRVKNVRLKVRAAAVLVRAGDGGGGGGGVPTESVTFAETSVISAAAGWYPFNERTGSTDSSLTYFLRHPEGMIMIIKAAKACFRVYVF